MPASGTGSPPRTTNDLVISTEGDEQHAPVAIERVALDDDGSPRSVQPVTLPLVFHPTGPDWCTLCTPSATLLTIQHTTPNP